MINLIHIGKSGGSTVKEEFNKAKIKFRDIHIYKPIYDKNSKYLIVIRNPISRFISAFNWRYYLLVERNLQHYRFKNEYNFVKKMHNVNNLVTNIHLLNNNHVHHIYENINFYLGNFLNVCNNKNIVGVVLQETLNEDMKKLFGIDVTHNINKMKNQTTKSKYISESNYAKLKKYLKKDYDCIDKLYEMKLINDEQYKILSK